MNTRSPTRDIVLVLGGGGIRGFAHVGVLRACERLGLQIQGFVGASVGALVGAYAAAGITPDAMAELAARMRKRDIFDVDYRSLLVRQHRARALYRGRGLTRFLEATLPARTFDALERPLICNAVNLNTGAACAFGIPGAGPVGLHEAVRASCALPGFFPPVRVGTDDYVDGGVLDPLPLPLAREVRTTRVRPVGGVPVALRGGRGGPVVVAVHLELIHTDVRVATPPTMFGVLDRSETVRSQLAVQRNLAACADLPLILVAPDVADRNLFDLRDVAAVVDAGERAALATLAGHPLLFPAAPAPRGARHAHRRPSDTRPIELPN